MMQMKHYLVLCLLTAVTTKAGATTKAREVVGGSMLVDLGNPGPQIMADAKIKRPKLVTAMRKTIAGLVSGVAEKDVTITLDKRRRLNGRGTTLFYQIKVDYSIKLPAGKTAAAAATIIKAANKTDIAASVKSNAAAVGHLPALAPGVGRVTAAMLTGGTTNKYAFIMDLLALTTTKAPEATSDARVAGLGMLIVTLIVSVW